ncbi:MAG TPA: response regulator transcription factor [Candidatus Acidoferrales bacterium]|nr:response regulator transcription factor [Candidatus Acidoferrales bacterium]
MAQKHTKKKTARPATRRPKSPRVPKPVAAKRPAASAKAGAGSAVTVCLLSPHPFVLENLRKLLDRPRFTVQAERVEFLPGQGTALPALPPAQVFVLDANGPLRAVVALITRVKSEQPASQVVVVSEEMAEEVAFPLMRLGIRGLLRYADASTQLAAAVISVLEGGYWVPRLLLSRFVFGILDQPRLPIPGEARKLSPRERQVHEALLENLSNKEIASRLNLSERTVKFHVSNVLAKHRVRRRADLILQNYHARPFEASGGKPSE